MFSISAFGLRDLWEDNTNLPPSETAVCSDSSSSCLRLGCEDVGVLSRWKVSA